jgi:hypothetical protein
MSFPSKTERWPELPYAAWKDTRDTLHLWTQVVGKVRLALTPWLNHSWHVALYVTARGLTTSPIPWRGGSIQIDFDFIDHVLWARTSEGQFRQIMLKPTSVAEFYEDVMIALRELGVDVRINTMPCEIADCVSFEQDMMPAMQTDSGAFCFPRTKCLRISAPVSWARPAPCISSGAASIWR